MKNMSTGDTISIIKETKDETEFLGFAEAFGAKLKGGEMIELAGDMGSGKTTFTKGLAKGAEVKDDVTSPTFTVQQRYKGRVDICHYDFYRLPEGGILSHELHETLGDKQVVVVIEWAETIEDVLPEERVKIHFTATGDHSRRLDVTAPKTLGYLA
jgi:tRNA threonylcarbamoyladenosine biosynthesis protein TsaE